MTEAGISQYPNWARWQLALLYLALGSLQASTLRVALNEGVRCNKRLWWEKGREQKPALSTPIPRRSLFGKIPPLHSFIPVASASSVCFNDQAFVS